MRSAVCLLALLSLAAAKNEVYDGHLLYQVSVNTVDQIKLLNELESHLETDVWSHAVPGKPGYILVSKNKKEQFENELKTNGVEYKIDTQNIKELIDLEEDLLTKASRTPYNASKVGLPFDRIHTYEQVDAFLEELAKSYPSTVTLVNAEKSFEGRDIKYLKISSSNFQDDSKPIVYMQSLLHAREWITLPATLYAIHKLVIDVTEQDLLQDIDWIILPIANPDGYSHTHESTRLWRKNRATGYTAGDTCVGVDLNRNFDVFWSQHSSNMVCSDTFHGRGPFSEPETSIIRDIVQEYKDRIELFLDIHSFGSMILFGYGTGDLPPNGLYLNMVGVQMAHAIDAVKMSWNQNYTVGNIAFVLYRASGSAGDYGQISGATYSYTFELPGYRPSGSGFLVDPDFIEQAGFETWEGIKVGARYVSNNYRPRQ